MRGEPDPGSDLLPAPYRNPWRLLVRDLAAVAASLRLKVREYWRRNNHGDLWVPAVWPGALAALFWPLLLLLVLLLAVLLSRGLAGLARPAPAILAPAVAEPPPLQAPARKPEESRESPLESPLESAEESLQPSAGEAPVQEEPVLEPPGGEPLPPPAPDPLLVTLGGGQADPLLLAVAADPARSGLSLTTAPAFAVLSSSQRARQADRWRRLAEEQGYDQLELHDGQGRLQGRTALVGSGMILLDLDPTE